MTVQLLWLLLLAIPIASIAWTVTHEDVFREPRDYCKQKIESSRRLWQRKFFYLFTCEYCFSHYITALFLMVTRFKLLYPDWRGYVISLFALVWIANVYMGIFAHLRLDISQERIEIKSKDLDLSRYSDGTRSAQDGVGCEGSWIILFGCNADCSAANTSHPRMTHYHS